MKKSLLSLLLVSVSAFAFAGEPAAKAPGTSSDAQLIEVAKSNIDKVDTNKDGKVSLQEFLAMPTQTFQSMDLNKDGFLTVDETVAFIKKVQAERQAAMEALISKMPKEKSPKAPK